MESIAVLRHHVLDPAGRHQRSDAHVALGGYAGSQVDLGNLNGCCLGGFLEPRPNAVGPAIVWDVGSCAGA